MRYGAPDAAADAAAAAPTAICALTSPPCKQSTLGPSWAHGRPSLGPSMAHGRPKLAEGGASRLLPARLEGGAIRNSGPSWAHRGPKLRPLMGPCGPKLGPINGPMCSSGGGCASMSGCVLNASWAEELLLAMWTGVEASGGTMDLPTSVDDRRRVNHRRGP